MRFITDVALPGIMLSILIILLAILLVAAVNRTVLSQEITKSEWVEIAPPPGEDGPCYAFFYNNKLSKVYKGVWCK